ncbi:steroid hormone receptor ERR2 isoform X2 [Nilaparvata lugens]|uniref:steroid hormone receptor ERR2 isoform X2 n=1 Tax=Nilaparvata lugens TaxID=108931 RepID=UPI000B99BDD2|nr:steroid hormone receptor ERR2 isoform X2 [Nilaparvata lugens]
MEHIWIDQMVSMMSSDSSTGMVHIKKEDEVRICRSTSDTLVVSATLESEYCDTKAFIEMGPHSPGSPDQQQFCSSTTQSLGDTILGHIEEGIKEEDLPRRLCLVCGDVASGFHYGVASCEACKAFFKRTIQGNIEYTCPAANDCEINKRRRKACQACRFQKCLRMGMLKEGVRLDRVRGGRQKYRRNPDQPYSALQHNYAFKFPVPLEDNKMLEMLTTCEPEVLSCLQPTNQTNDSSSPGLSIIAMLSDLYDRELVGIIGWAKQIPGFTDLTLNDQMRLLQSTWAEILTLSLAYRSLPHTGKLRFAANFSLDERQAKDCGAYEVYQVCVQIIERLERLSIAKEEYFLLKALVLANSDVRLDDFSSLKKFRDSILSALTDCVTFIRPNTSTSHMQNLLLCLPALRQANQTVRRFWVGVHRDGNILMNKLFVEMLEACIR